MEWLFAAVVLLLLVLFPGFRKVTLLLATLAITIFIGFILITGYLDRERANEELSVIKANNLSISNVSLIGDDSKNLYWAVDGRIENKSSYELKSLKITVKFFDCPSNKTPEITPDCKIYWEHSSSVFISIPPNQVRDFNASIQTPNSQPLGFKKWTYEVNEIRAKLKK